MSLWERKCSQKLQKVKCKCKQRGHKAKWKCKCKQCGQIGNENTNVRENAMQTAVC